MWKDTTTHTGQVLHGQMHSGGFLLDLQATRPNSSRHPVKEYKVLVPKAWFQVICE